jgi:hypothetical protein
MGTREIIQEAADAPLTDDPMQALIHFGITVTVIVSFFGIAILQYILQYGDAYARATDQGATPNIPGSIRPTTKCMHFVLAFFHNL